MVNIVKKYFTNFNNIKNYLKLYKKGVKLYINSNNDIYFKKNYRSSKYILGYDYNIKSCNFNVLCSIFKVIYKKNADYANIIKYINLFNNKFLFIKKNEI